MASFVIEDEFSSLEAVVFPRDYKAIEDLLSSIQEMTPYVIIGKISYRDGMPQLVVSDIKKIQKVTTHCMLQLAMQLDRF